MNEGFIEADGTVHAKRGARVVALKCPYTKGIEQCGDWCPHFRVQSLEMTVQIHVCQGSSLVFYKKEFEDRRK